jgi:hypothetical protein
MILYAIQQISTLKMIPAGGKHLGGHTKQEPKNSRPPRTFITLQSAKRALACYIAGRWNNTGHYDYFGEYEDYGPEPSKGTKRDRLDFRIIILNCRVTLIKESK